MNVHIPENLICNVDRDFFIPYNEFLQKYLFDIKKVENYILNKVKLIGSIEPCQRTTGINRILGLVFEAYVKLSLSEFDRIKSSSLIKRNPLTSGSVGNRGDKFITNEFGNVFFYSKNGLALTEIDEVWEYYNNGIKRPIVIEAGISRKPHRADMYFKLMRRIYKTKPFYCRIINEKGLEEPGLYKRNEYSRLVIVPDFIQNIKKEEKFQKLANTINYN